MSSSTYVKLLLSNYSEIRMWVDMDAKTANKTLVGSTKKDWQGKPAVVKKVTILHELKFMCFKCYSSSIINANYPSFSVKCTSIKEGEEKAKEFLKVKYPESFSNLRIMYDMNLTPDQTELNHIDHLLTN